MTVIWEQRLEHWEQTARRLDTTSPNFTLHAMGRQPNEWRMMFSLSVHVMVLQRNIQRVGPCKLGLRFHRRHLTCAPASTELVTVLFPERVFHPNVAASGSMCLGHTRPGFSLEAILHSVWGGLSMNFAFVNTTHGEVLNWRAADYVRQNLHLFPFTRRGFFESEAEGSVRD